MCFARVWIFFWIYNRKVKERKPNQANDNSICVSQHYVLMYSDILCNFLRVSRGRTEYSLPCICGSKSIFLCTVLPLNK